MTILEAIQKSSDFLAKKGVDSPRLQSELLLAHVLKTKRLKLYLEFARELTDAEAVSLREFVQRRGSREPLQHILGTANFCGLEIRVNRNVLTPRPETELLAEQGWMFLNSLNRETTFFDFGTGSGCIAIAVAHHAQQSRGIAIDNSADALVLAAENVTMQSLDSRLTLLKSDGFASIPSELSCDLILSNPPYIPSDEIPGLQEEVRNFDPHTALDGGAEGLDFYRVLASDSRKHLRAGGKLMAEFGDGQEELLDSLFSAKGWRVESILKDLSDRPRVLIAIPL